MPRSHVCEPERSCPGKCFIRIRSGLDILHFRQHLLQQVRRLLTPVTRVPRLRLRRWSSRPRPTVVQVDASLDCSSSESTSVMTISSYGESRQDGRLVHFKCLPAPGSRLRDLGRERCQGASDANEHHMQMCIRLIALRDLKGRAPADVPDGGARHMCHGASDHAPADVPEGGARQMCQWG